jgi:hypothetical protein
LCDPALHGDLLLKGYTGGRWARFRFLGIVRNSWYDKSVESLIASWERALTGQGLAAACLHVELPASWKDQVVAFVGARRCQVSPAEGQGRLLVRVDPSVDLWTFAALLRRAGWQVHEAVPDSVLTARPAATSGDVGP